MKRFLAAMRFLTILPIGGTCGTAEADLAGSLAMFPLVGLLLGALAAALAWILAPTTLPLVTAALLVLLLLGFSGCLHADGLADAADGFLSARPRDKILEIMRDSRVGAMGMIAVVCVLLLKFAALASIAPGRLWPAALLMPLAGRCATVWHVALLPYARESGAAAVFYGRPRWPAAVWAAIALAAVAWGVLGFGGLLACAVCAVAALLLAGYVYGKIGGATGDTLGAACEIVETVMALALALGPLRPFEVIS
ncbi:MAG: adenosylcobinamide-GDP ribazoletransferase [Thermoguttaceae bacterium]|jgi:adenosylcobinamide-GDP ribazoletransferase